MNRAATGGKWRTETLTRSFPDANVPGGDVIGTHGDMGESWLSAVKEALPDGGGHLDLGCGGGRMTFALANRWAPDGWSIGADRDEEALDRARARAIKENLSGARFLALDVEKEDYTAILSGGLPDLVTAHLCMGLEIVRRAASVLPPGGMFACVALHKDLWREIGRPSRFALAETELESMLERFDLIPQFRRTEKEVLEIKNPQDFLESSLSADFVSRWKKSGRWDALNRYLEGGGRELVARAQLQCIARKAAP
jgi:ubiquinone/menaquinone biosynthesis C-methylase UbiE